VKVTSVLDGGEWSTSCSGRFIPGETAPGTHCIGGWMDPRPGLDVIEKRKILSRREPNSGLPVQRYTDWANPAPKLKLIKCHTINNIWVSLREGVNLSGATFGQPHIIKIYMIVSCNFFSRLGLHLSQTRERLMLFVKAIICDTRC
jgi:hypothetical protein